MGTSEWTLLVLTLTLIAVIFYARETRRQADGSVRMAEAMHEQTLSADRPFLLIEVPSLEATEFLASPELDAGLDPHSGYPKRLAYRVFNAGRGPAKEIGTSIRHPAARYEGHARDVLRSGDTWEVKIELQAEAAAHIADSFEESPPKGLKAFLVRAGAAPLEEGYDCGIVVTYTDIHDRAYLTYLLFGMIATTDEVQKVVTSRVIRPAEQRVVPLPS